MESMCKAIACLDCQAAESEKILAASLNSSLGELVRVEKAMREQAVSASEERHSLVVCPHPEQPRLELKCASHSTATNGNRCLAGPGNL